MSTANRRRPETETRPAKETASGSNGMNEPQPITITIPLGVPVRMGEGGPYLPQHVELRLRHPSHRIAMRRLYEALDAAHARLADGKPVYDYADSIRWILEQLSAAWAD